MIAKIKNKLSTIKDYLIKYNQSEYSKISTYSIQKDLRISTSQMKDLKENPEKLRIETLMNLAEKVSGIKISKD